MVSHGGLQRVATIAAAIVFAGALAAVTAASCAVSSFELVDNETLDGGHTTNSSSSQGGSGGQSPSCAHAVWPSAPAVSDPGDDIELVLAVRSVDFGENDLSDGPTVGYDLDGRCTCQGEQPSCQNALSVGEEQCDGPAGRDNATAAIFKQLGAVDPAKRTSEAWTAEVESGNWSLLIRLRNYNGKANDHQVQVALYPSPGMDQDSCNDNPVPSWDGSDQWPVSATSLIGYGAGGGGTGGCGGGSTDEALDSPKYVDDNAYVAAGVMVANLPELALVLNRGYSNTILKLTAGFVSGRLETDAKVGGWSLRDGLLVGRWKLSDFFETLSNLDYKSDPLCTDTAIYQAIKGSACPKLDITSMLAGPTKPCDALSFALAIEAQSAKLGSIDPSAPPQSACPAETNPVNDSCD